MSWSRRAGTSAERTDAALPSLQKGFAGGKVSLRDCFSLFTKEEELELENAPVCGVRRGTVRVGVLVGSTWARGCTMLSCGEYLSGFVLGSPVWPSLLGHRGVAQRCGSNGKRGKFVCESGCWKSQSR